MMAGAGSVAPWRRAVEEFERYLDVAPFETWKVEYDLAWRRTSVKLYALDAPVRTIMTDLRDNLVRDIIRGYELRGNNRRAPRPTATRSIGCIPILELGHA